jgi:hypothetical protein
MKNGEWIFIGYGYESHKAQLMCQIEKVVDNKITFHVENGMWTGTFDIDQQCIRVHQTREVFKAQIVYDLQDKPRGEYNHVLDTINNRLEQNGEPMLRVSISGCAPSESIGDISTPARSNFSRNKADDKDHKLRTVILTKESYLVVDLPKHEVRLFHRKTTGAGRGKHTKNVFIRSMVI